jgi:hypothetical protein
MDDRPEFEKKIAAGRLIGAAILASIGICVLIVAWIQAHFRPFFGFARPADVQAFRGTLFAASIILVVLNRVINGRLLKTPFEGDARKGLRILFLAAVISLGLAELPAILGLVLFLTCGLSSDFIALAFVSLVLVFMYFPRPTSWESYLALKPPSCRIGGNR